MPVQLLIPCQWWFGISKPAWQAVEREGESQNDLLALHWLVFPLSLPFGCLPRRLGIPGWFLFRLAVLKLICALSTLNKLDFFLMPNVSLLRFKIWTESREL